MTGLLLGGALARPAMTGPASAADLSTCHGRAVTIAVTDPAAPISGTPDDDVVAVEVTGPRGFALATGAGDDTVCIYGPATVIMSTGEGDDDVDTSAMAPAPGVATHPQISLGLGDDTFLGGPGGEIVNDDYDGGLLTAQDGDDVADLQIDLPASITGGDGTDTVRRSVSRQPATVVDDVQQTLSVGGVTTSVLSFESFDVVVGDSLTFRGSDADETLAARRVCGTEDQSGGAKQVLVDMGGGDDALDVGQGVVGTWTGGSGDDLLSSTRNRTVPTSASRPSLRVDLAKGTWRLRGDGRARISSWEALKAERYQSVAVTGSHGADDVAVVGCQVEVSGGAGRDRIDVDTSTQCGHTPLSGVLHGGAGADRITGDKGTDHLYGDAGDDVLRGRGGRDAAYGGAGRDRCTAERRVSC